MGLDLFRITILWETFILNNWREEILKLCLRNLRKRNWLGKKEVKMNLKGNKEKEKVLLWLKLKNNLLKIWITLITDLTQSRILLMEVNLIIIIIMIMEILMTMMIHLLLLVVLIIVVLRRSRNLYSALRISLWPWTENWASKKDYKILWRICPQKDLENTAVMKWIETRNLYKKIIDFLGIMILSR